LFTFRSEHHSFISFGETSFRLGGQRTAPYRAIFSGPGGAADVPPALEVALYVGVSSGVVS
jgi:hypothetical protein